MKRTTPFCGLISGGILLTAATLSTHAATVIVDWTDFTSYTDVTPTYTALGAIDRPNGDNVGVTFTETSASGINNGNISQSYVWEPSLFSPSTILDASSTPSGRARTPLWGNGSTFTFSFDQAVTDPYLLIGGAGGGNQGETFDFGGLSVSYLGGTLVQSGNTFIGGIGPGNYGAFQINGTFTSFSFTQSRSSGDNNGQGTEFQVGLQIIPEPSSMSLLGLGGLGLLLRRKRG